MTNILKNRLGILTATLTAIGTIALIGASSASAAITTTLSPGDNNSAVSELQTFLSTDPSVYPEGLVTGYYGGMTTAAVQRFQCKYGIVCSGSVGTTGYGRVGPVTLAKVIELQGGVATPPLSGDVSAPYIHLNSIVLTPGTNSATLRWTTSEAARGRVMFGLSWPFLYATAPSFTDAGAGFDSVAEVNLSGLASNATYYYVLESKDASGNIQWTTARSFITN